VRRRVWIRIWSIFIVRRRIGGRGGGSDPGPKSNKGTTVLLAAGLAVALGAGGTAATAGRTASVGASAPSGSTSARSQARTSSRKAQIARARLALRGAKLLSHTTDNSTHIDVPGERSADEACVENSYGEVQEFLRAHPCRALQRELYVIDDRPAGEVLGVAAWVEMERESVARELRCILDSPGTGNITELSREIRPYRSIRLTTQLTRPS
jgi:hypothetical protein